jgi:RluA family pseudouridine synthase
VSAIVAKAGEAPSAIADGRVFVGPKRVTKPDLPVRPGDAVRIGPPPKPASAAEVPLLFERDGLVACIKPAGIPTVPDHGASAHALVSVVARRLGRPPDALRVTSRLDRDVSGVVVFALDEDAETRLRRARAEGHYHRRYVAIAKGTIAAAAGVWAAPIGRAADPGLRAVNGPDAKPATTRWARVAATASPHDPFALLVVDPVTGRTHQIRVHASHAGVPLVGDRDYGGPTRLTLASGAVLAPSRIALHAARVVVPSRRGEPIEAIAPLPPELVRLWTSLGGDESASARVLEASTPAA